MINSPQNDKVKLAHALQTQAKARRKERKIVLEGTRLVRDAIERGRKPEFVLYEPQLIDYELLAHIQNLGLKPTPVTADILKHVSSTEHPQGVVAVFPMPMPDLPRKPSRVLILDAVRDPGNMGTILRTAAAAGAQVAILSPDCVDPYNPKVLRGGMGAHFRIPIAEAPWNEIALYCDGLPVYLATGAGDVDYRDADWSRWALIIGSEAHGAGGEAGKIATHRVRIPMAAETESVNAAVAAGVLLFEATRARRG